MTKNLLCDKHRISKMRSKSKTESVFTGMISPRSQYIIDNLCIMNEDIRSIKDTEERDKLVLKDYLENCISRKGTVELLVEI